MLHLDAALFSDVARRQRFWNGRLSVLAASGNSGGVQQAGHDSVVVLVGASVLLLLLFFCVWRLALYGARPWLHTSHTILHQAQPVHTGDAAASML
jgi:hypothetical protein